MTEEMNPLEALAADYVLGTLDAAERQRVQGQLAHDPELARLVAEWENRLAPIAQAIPPVQPPARVWHRIQESLDRDQGPAALRKAFWRALAFWRWSTAGATALAAALAAYILVSPGPTSLPPEGRYVAVLSEGAASPAWLVTVDLATQSLTIRPVAELAPRDQAFELWMVASSDTPPRSLGLLDPVREISLTVPDDLTGAAQSRAVLAVSLEPAGGSPTGLPTGPVVFQGALLPVSE